MCKICVAPSLIALTAVKLRDKLAAKFSRGFIWFCVYWQKCRELLHIVYMQLIAKCYISYYNGIFNNEILYFTQLGLPLCKIY